MADIDDLKLFKYSTNLRQKKVSSKIEEIGKNLFSMSSHYKCKEKTSNLIPGL